MSHSIDLIKWTAEQVRYWAEGRAVGSEGEEDLSGWCAIASAELWRQLAAEGIAAEIHCWVCPKDQESAHVYLVVEDHVVCITATQFRAMRDIPVFIEHVKEASRYDWFNGQHIFKTPEELIRWQK